MKAFFRSPEKAAEPVILLACSNALGKRSGVYLHMMREKQSSALARDDANKKTLWEKSQTLIDKHANEAQQAKV